jgi:parallel beta-helix repeat protein
LPALAADGAMPIWEPTEISESGSYVLTRDIVTVVNPAILITADHVHLDLNGFRVEGSADIFAADVIQVSGGVKGTFIENGTVVGGGAGVRLSTNTTQFVLRDLTIRGGRTGVGVASNSARGVIERNVIQECSDDGISVSGDGMTIRDNIVSASVNGIVVESCNSCRIVGNTVQNTAISAISVNQGAGNLILRNSVSNAAAGIRISQGGYHTVDSNLLSGNGGFGIHLRDTSFENVYRANVSRNNGGVGCTGVGNADFCDDGANNTSSGDNFMPDLR